MATSVITAEMQRANADAFFPGGRPGLRKADPGQQATATARKGLERQIASLKSDRPVTLLNLNPFSLKINGGMLFPEEIPACPLGQPYTLHVFRDVKWTHRDKGCDMNNVWQIEPVPYIPMLLAAEYMREYVQQGDGSGGVICYIGDFAPETIKPGQKVSVPEMAFDENGELFVQEVEKDFHQLMGRVRSLRNSKLLRDIQQANGWYENDSQRMNVNDTHRDKARLAKQEGLLEELPRWVLVDNDVTQKQPTACPSCQFVPKVGAIMCSNCSYILDVVETFRLRPSECIYGSAEMDRLTPEQWKVVDAIHAERTLQRSKRKAVPAQ